MAVLHKAADTWLQQLTFMLQRLNLFIPEYSWCITHCVCVYVCGSVYASECACLFVLSFPISHISCLWFHRQQGPSHESWGMTQTYADLWLAAVTQSGREREGTRRGKAKVVGAVREQKRRGVEGSVDGMRFPPLTRGCRDEQLAINTCVAALRTQTLICACRHPGAAENSKTEALHNICQLSGREQAQVQDQSSPSCGLGLEDGTDRKREWGERERDRELGEKTCQ